MSEPSRLVQVFEVIESLKETGVLVDYAIGGAMGVLFYAEPLRTYDLDVFVFLPEEASAIVSLSPLYAELARRGFATDAEHVLVHGVPVQFLPAWNELAEEALRESWNREYDVGIEVRVIRPEHLVALAVQTGGRKRREHVARLLEFPGFERERLADILRRHGLAERWGKEWADA